MSLKLTVIDSLGPTKTPSRSIEFISILETELTLIQAEYPEVSLEKDLPNEEWVRCDPSLGHAIRECLENAITHFDRDMGELYLGIRVERLFSTVTLLIRDNVPGLPPNVLRAIRSEHKSDLYHTNRAGIWLVIWLCRFHNTTVNFQPSGDGGTLVQLAFDTVTPLNTFPKQR